MVVYYSVRYSVRILRVVEIASNQLRRLALAGPSANNELSLFLLFSLLALHLHLLPFPHLPLTLTTILHSLIASSSFTLSAAYFAPRSFNPKL